MLNLLGVEMLFFFKIATVFSLAKLSISAIKLLQGKSIYKTDDGPLFVEKTFK